MPRTLKKKVPLAQVAGFHFDHEAHAYTLDSKPLKGVTTILGVIAKPALIQWSASCAVDYIESTVPPFNEDTELPIMTISRDSFASICKEARVAHRKKKEAAGEAGTDVHAQIEDIIKSSIEHGEGLIKGGVSVVPQVQQFLDWATTNKVRFLASEQRLYSKEFWYAGTADFVCEKDGKMYVGDVKTSSAIYSEHFIQASAYAHALEAMDMAMSPDIGQWKMDDLKFDGVLIVNIPKKGGLNVQENYDLKGNFEAFKAALVLHNYLNK